jgi:hypothetical protein
VQIYRKDEANNSLLNSKTMHKQYLLKTIILVLVSSSLWGQAACEHDGWYEKDGIAVVEMENQANLNGWSVATTTTGYTGNGYLIWTGAENFNVVNRGFLTYKVKITTPGKYAFDWRVSVNNGTSITEHNDTWLSITDVDNFWAEKSTTNSLLQPKPTCSSSTLYKCPMGSSASNHFKVYGGKINTFEWKAVTSDNDSHAIFFEKKTEGIISINIAARSSFHAIDRLVIYRVPQISASTARNLNNNQQDYLCNITSIEDIKDQSFTVYPNPTKKKLVIKTELTGTADIMNMTGQVLASYTLSNEMKDVDISSFNAGIYFVLFTSKEGLKVRKLAVQ